MFDVARTRSLLSKFQEQLRTRLTVEPSNGAEWDRIHTDAHALISTAGMLGFQQLSALCRDLEQACVAKRASAEAAVTALALTRNAQVAAAERVSELLDESAVADAA